MIHFIASAPPAYLLVIYQPSTIIPTTMHWPQWISSFPPRRDPSRGRRIREGCAHCRRPRRENLTLFLSSVRSVNVGVSLWGLAQPNCHTQQFRLQVTDSLSLSMYRHVSLTFLSELLGREFPFDAFGIPLLLLHIAIGRVQQCRGESKPWRSHLSRS